MVDGPAAQPLSRSVVILHSIAIHIDILSEGVKLEYSKHFHLSFKSAFIISTHKVFVDMKWLVKDNPLNNFGTCRSCKRASVVIEAS